MKKLIAIEEHYLSETINRKVMELTGKRAFFAPPVDGENYESPAAFAAGRLAHMDQAGIDAELLSYASAFPAQMDAEYAGKLCSELNDEMREVMAICPERFFCLAALPVSDPAAAAQELERTVRQCGFKGAVISGVYRGHRLEEPYYFPIYQKAVELDVPIFLHPGIVAEPIREYYYDGPWNPQVTFQFSTMGIGWHYDIGIQIIRMILAGVFEKFPALKIITGHWGEVVSYQMYRLDEMKPSVTGLKQSISACLKQHVYVNPSGLMYPEQFRFCLDTFGADHILWGEDYPYRAPENTKSMLENYPLAQAEREKIAYRNAEKLLRL